jgi:hypothetical protein
MGNILGPTLLVGHRRLGLYKLTDEPGWPGKVLCTAYNAAYIL